VTENPYQSANDNLARKLDEIKSVMQIHATTSSVFDSIEQRLKDIEAALKKPDQARHRDKMQTLGMAIAIMGWSAMVSAFVSTPESIEPINLKWVIFTVGILGVIMGVYTFKRNKSNL
jgi:hypothetical protein